MFQWYRAMRGTPLAWGVLAAALAGLGCPRSLQRDDGGPGVIGVDGAVAETISGDARIADTAAPFDTRIPVGVERCGPATTYRGQKIPIDMLLVVDRSVADPATWNQLRSALADLTRTLDTVDQYRWGLKLFPEDGPACGAGTATDKIDVPIGDGDSSRLNAALAAATPTGNGTPTAAALTAANAYLASLPDDRAKYLMLVTDGAPSCAGTVETRTSDAVQAEADAIAAIDPEVLGTFPAFVVGAGVTAARDVSALNLLAEAGRLARPQPMEFYPSSDLTELRTVLTPMWDYSCTFAMPETPPGATQVVVTLNDVAVPRDDARQNGWAYTDDSHAWFSFYGAPCVHLRSSQEAVVQITFLCLFL